VGLLEGGFFFFMGSRTFVLFLFVCKYGLKFISSILSYTSETREAVKHLSQKMAPLLVPFITPSTNAYIDM
jgi:hypothetical protein